MAYKTKDNHDPEKNEYTLSIFPKTHIDSYPIKTTYK